MYNIERTGVLYRLERMPLLCPGRDVERVGCLTHECSSGVNPVWLGGRWPGHHPVCALATRPLRQQLAPRLPAVVGTWTTNLVIQPSVLISADMSR
jgi:hypothetical protein